MALHRRVVATGLGVVCPLGVGMETVWPKLLQGHCGIRRVTGEEYQGIPSRVAGFVPRGQREGEFDNRRYVSSSDERFMTQYTIFALAAADEALKQADWLPESEEDRNQTGVAVGTGFIDVSDILYFSQLLDEKGYKKLTPYAIPRVLPHMAAGNISLKYTLRGPFHSASVACVTGTCAIGDAARFIQRGDANVMVAGATEAVICPLSIAGFARAGAVSKNFNDTPEKSSRPFDKDRDGFVMAEGAAVVVLEELEHAKQRGARILAEILGYGLAGDAHHLTSPSEEGVGAELCMRRAMKDAQLGPHDVTYINAHATSTPMGDRVENDVVKRIFKCHDNQHFAMSSTKGATGHLQGAAGALEAAFTIMACHEAKLPPTINLDATTEDFDLNYVPGIWQPWRTAGPASPSGRRRRVALSNSVAFAGANASICIGSYENH